MKAAQGKRDHACSFSSRGVPPFVSETVWNQPAGFERHPFPLSLAHRFFANVRELCVCVCVCMCKKKPWSKRLHENLGLIQHPYSPPPPGQTVSTALGPMDIGEDFPNQAGGEGCRGRGVGIIFFFFFLFFFCDVLGPAVMGRGGEGWDLVSWFVCWMVRGTVRERDWKKGNQDRRGLGIGKWLGGQRWMCCGLDAEGWGRRGERRRGERRRGERRERWHLLVVLYL